MKRYRYRMAGIVVMAFCLASCATTQKAAKAVVTEEAERMFWKISGTDKDGNPSTVYIQGTIHVADDRSYPLEDRVWNAYRTADRLAAEISTEDMDDMETEMLRLSYESLQKANGRIVSDRLTDGQKETLYRFLGKEVADQLANFEPWITTNTVSNMLYQNSGLSAEKGLDIYFLNAAMESGRTVEGLDTMEEGLAVLTFGSYDTQLVILQETLDDLADPTDLYELMDKLYEAYLNDDKQGIAELSYGDMEKDMREHAFYKDYHKMIFEDRNKKWAKHITSYLSEGGTTFIFAGCAHWLGDKSVFTYLRKMGTIE